MYSGLIRRLALSASLTEVEAEEVVQEVLISVARHIGSFKYDPAISSFKSWLSTMAHWRIRSQLRKRWRQELVLNDPEEGRSTGLLERIPSSEPGIGDLLDADWANEMFQIVLSRVKKRVDPKQYQIYFLHVLSGHEIAQVSRQLKVGRGQIYVAKFRIKRLIEKELKTLALEVERANHRAKPAFHG